MTTQEALKLLRDDKLADGEVDADKFNEAYNMAIRSLEAWEKLIKFAEQAQEDNGTSRVHIDDIKVFYNFIRR